MTTAKDIKKTTVEGEDSNLLLVLQTFLPDLDVDESNLKNVFTKIVKLTTGGLHLSIEDENFFMFNNADEMKKHSYSVSRDIINDLGFDGISESFKNEAELKCINRDKMHKYMERELNIFYTKYILHNNRQSETDYISKSHKMYVDKNLIPNDITDNNDIFNWIENNTRVYVKSITNDLDYDTMYELCIKEIPEILEELNKKSDVFDMTCLINLLTEMDGTSTPLLSSERTVKVDKKILIKTILVP